MEEEEFIDEEDRIDSVIAPKPAISPFEIPYEGESLEELLHQDDVEKAPTLNIRQINCWKYYIDIKSPTYGNGTQSALRAGYTESSANNVTSMRFFREKLRRLNMLPRAEKVLKKTLIMNTKDEQGREQADLLRIQVDAAKHITKTLGKDEGYSERSEVTGKDGNPIVFMPAELIEKYSIPTESEDITNKQ